MVLPQEMTRLARTRIGDDQPHIEVAKLRVERVDGGLLREVHDHAPRRNPALARDLLGKRLEQLAAPRRKRDVKSFRRQPAHEFGADAR